MIQMLLWLELQPGAYHVDCAQLIESLLKKEPALFRPAGRAGSGNSSESS